MQGLNRNLSTALEKQLSVFPAVCILGARQVGKTTLAKQIRPDWQYFDLERPSVLQRIQHDPEFFFQQFSDHLIIDEAQECPDLFKVLRGVIDADRSRKGRFLITGSSHPTLQKQLSESLAGRIGLVELGPLKANEWAELPLSPFYQLFEHPISRSTLPQGEPPLSQEHVSRSWMLGGYPEPCMMSSHQERWMWFDAYQTNYLQRDVSILYPNLNRLAYHRFLTTLSQLSGTIVNRSDLARSIEVSASSVRDYLSIAEGTFVWRNIPAFDHRPTKRMVKKPKGFVRDSGLLHHLRHLHRPEDIALSPQVGHSFEGWVTEELCRGLDALSIPAYRVEHYRTQAGAEIDLILSGSFGTLPIEIKHGTQVPRRQLQTLSSWVSTQQLDFGLLINQSEQACWLTPNVFQLPARWL